MAIYKNKDIETNINERGAELGNINVNFYTEDNGTASIRIKMKNQQGAPINFNNTDMLPRLDLYAKDGSIFTKEPVDIVLADQGLIQYKVSDYVIRHEGKMDCKLFLENGNESVHVANFYFVIKDSGITSAIGKEIKVEVLEDMVRNVMTDNAMGLLDDEYKEKLDSNLKNYLVENKEVFKGEKGDPLKYEELTIEQKEELKGEPGQPADNEIVAELIKDDVAPVLSEVQEARGSYSNLNERINNTSSKPLKYGNIEMPTDFKPTIPFTFYRDNDSRIKHNMDFQTRYKNGTKIYVRLNGDDSKGDGTPSKPYRTMTKAVDVAVKGMNSKYEIITNIPVFNRDEFIFNQTVTNKTISIISEGTYDESAKVYTNYSVDTGNLDNAWDTGVNEFIRTTTANATYNYRVYGSNITLKYRKDTSGGLAKVTVDGKNSTKKEFTTYSDTPTTVQEELYFDLDEGYHDVKVTFIGADPDVSYGSTPRLLLAIQNVFTTSYKDYTKAYRYSKNKTLVSSNATYTWSEDGTGTFTTNRTSVRNVIDLYNVDIYGLPIPLKNATSIEECKANKNTWFSNGTSVWVHRNDETEPTINSTVVNIGVSGVSPKLADGGCIYFENFVFTSWITANPLNVTNDSTTPKGELCVNKCLMVGQRSNSSRGNGVAIEGVKNAYLFDCITAYAQLDGFNYHYTNINENEKRDCLAIEYNCKAYDLGLDVQGAGSNNASTAHEGSSILRIGTVGYRNTGATIIDVNGCYSILYDCNVRTPMLDGIKGKGRGYSFTTENTGRNGKAYLINCGSVEAETSLVIDTNHVAYINNFKHDNPIQATGEIHFI